MKIRRMILSSGLCLGLFASGFLVAQNVDARRHPNLAEAQHLIQQAVERLDAAQNANRGDMEGHDARAKGLLEQAYREIKAAAEAANRHRR